MNARGRVGCWAVVSVSLGLCLASTPVRAQSGFPGRSNADPVAVLRSDLQGTRAVLRQAGAILSRQQARLAEAERRIDEREGAVASLQAQVRRLERTIGLLQAGIVGVGLLALLALLRRGDPGRRRETFELPATDDRFRERLGAAERRLRALETGGAAQAGRENA